MNIKKSNQFLFVIVNKNNLMKINNFFLKIIVVKGKLQERDHV